MIHYPQQRHDSRREGLSTDRRRRAGVTLVEFLVAFGIFVVIIAIASSSFVRSIRIQRAALQLMAVNDNMGITIEQMMREMRTGYNFCTAAVPLDDPRFADQCSRLGANEIQFVTAGNVVTRYRLKVDPGLDISAIQKGIAVASWDPTVPISTFCNVSGGGEFDPDNGICYRNITADNVKVTSVYFEPRYNNSDYRPPRVIMSLSITSNDPLVSSMTTPTTIQTTISARCGGGTCPSDM